MLLNLSENFVKTKLVIIFSLETKVSLQQLDRRKLMYGSLATVMRNMQVKFDLTLSVYSFSFGNLTSFKFNFCLKGWPQQEFIRDLREGAV